MPFVNYFIIPFVFDGCIAANSLVINLYAQDLGASPLDLGMLSFLWGVCYAAFALATGRLAHRLPRRGTMIGAMWCFCAAVITAQLARLPWHLYFVAALNGCGCACFWPLFAALLHDDDERVHARKMTCFNVGWTAGLAVGCAVGGFLKEMGSAPAINALAGAIALLSIYFQWSTRGGLPAVHGERDEAAPPVAVQPPNVCFLHMAWLANFAIFAGASVVYSLFPKLARELGFPDRSIGLVTALIVLSQAGAFLYVCRTVWWRYRLWPLLFGQGLGALAIVFVATGSGYAVFGCAMVGLGVARAVTYASSLQYGLADPKRRGRNMGVHEMLIGAAVAAGALMGGIAGNYISLRAAFWVGAGLIVVCMAGQTAMQFASRQSRRADE